MKPQVGQRVMFARAASIWGHTYPQFSHLIGIEATIVDTSEYGVRLEWDSHEEPGKWTAQTDWTHWCFEPDQLFDFISPDWSEYLELK